MQIPIVGASPGTPDGTQGKVLTLAGAIAINAALEQEMERRFAKKYHAQMVHGVELSCGSEAEDEAALEILIHLLSVSPPDTWV